MKKVEIRSLLAIIACLQHLIFISISQTIGKTIQKDLFCILYLVQHYCHSQMKFCHLFNIACNIVTPYNSQIWLLHHIELN